MAGIIRQRGATHHWATSYGFPPELNDYMKSVPLEPGRGSVVGRILLTGKSVHVPDVLADQEYTYLDAQKKLVIAAFSVFLCCDKECRLA